MGLGKSGIILLFFIGHAWSEMNIPFQKLHPNKGLPTIGSSKGFYQNCTKDIDFAEVTYHCLEEINLIYNKIIQEHSGFKEGIEGICSTFDSTVKPCVEESTTSCPSDVQSRVPEFIAEYRGRTCVPGSTAINAAATKNAEFHDASSKQEISESMEWMADQILWENIYLDLIRIVGDSDRSNATLDDYTRYYSVYYKGIRSELSTIQGDDQVKSLMMFYSYVYMSMGILLDANIFVKDFTFEPRDKERSTVTVFGDPHLRVYKKGELTCGSPGETSYLRNKFMMINGTNTEASSGWSATYMTEVSIDFRDDRGQIMASYESGSTFGKTFTDGQTTKYKGTPNEISIEVIQNNMARIVYDASGTVIILNKISYTYMMTIRASDNLFDESSGLLVQGCFDKIDISGTQGRGKRSAVCSGVDESMQHFCEYDYSVTGDEELAKSVNAVIEIEEKTAELDEELTDGNTGVRNSYFPPVMFSMVFICLKLF